MKQKTISNPDSVQLLIRYGADFIAGSAEKFPGKRGYRRGGGVTTESRKKYHFAAADTILLGLQILLNLLIKSAIKRVNQ